MKMTLSSEEQRDFNRNGYVLRKALFDTNEIDLLRQAIEEDPAIRKHMYNREDAEGRPTRMVTWNHPGDSVYGLAARTHRVVDSMEALLGGEVYHYHSKLTAKEPREGGAWEWHQDYGYWYHNGCLFPHMASVMVALDQATRENGCLQVLRGSHTAGRIEHGLLDGDQVGADLKRVSSLLDTLETVHVEMGPGDGLFFHCNTLHRSDANLSDARRWTVLMCYNLASNNPVLEHHHPQYTPLEKVSDAAILDAGLKLADDTDAFMQKASAPAELTKKSGKTFSR